MTGRRARAGALIAFLMALVVSACSEEPAQELEPPAYKVPIEGTDRYRVYLTPEAAVRIDVQLEEVVENDIGVAISSDALILDTDGLFWVYVTPENLAYERVQLSSVREEDGMAFFTQGPAVGTPVVVVGVPELYGEETGVGK